MPDNPYKILNSEEIETPALIVLPQVVEENIKLALNIVGKNVLRPHVKTFKIREVAQLLMGMGVNRFKCATIAEAEMLAMVNVKDILLAYQPVGKNIDRLKKLIEAFPETKFSCLVDNVETLLNLSKEFNEKPLNVFIDLNVGMNRTGVKAENAKNFVISVINTAGVLLKGIHAYDGHIHEIDFESRKKLADEVYLMAEEIRADAVNRTKKELELVVGGTPTFPIFATKNNVTCSPGTFVFWDAGYQQYSDLPFKIATCLLTRIISIIDGKSMCLDLGHKSVASENPLDKRASFLSDDPIELISHSEEHLVVHVQDTSLYKIGQVLYAIPYHICPTVALHSDIQVVENQIVTKKWNVAARNRKISI
jgi:D-threonine aldolase